MEKKRPSETGGAPKAAKSGEMDLDEFKKLIRLRRATRITRSSRESAYSYIYDGSVQDKKYSRDLSLIENRLTDLGLNGKIHRLSRFKNLKELLEDDVRAGVRNIVIFGSDETFLRAITSCLHEGLTFAFVPFCEKSVIAKILGVGDRFQAIQALSARLTQVVDIGLVNGRPFFSSLRIPHCQARIVCDGNFSVEAVQDRDIEVFNLHIPKSDDDKLSFAPRPSDGALELVVKKINKLSIFGGWKYALSRSGRDSLFLFRQAGIFAKDPVAMYVDGRKISQQNPRIQVIPKALKLIVGKSRTI